MNWSCSYLLLSLCSCSYSLLSVVLVIVPSVSSQSTAALLAPCQACRTLVNSFTAAYNRTQETRGERSSERLASIRVQLCRDLSVARYAEQCSQLAEDWEQLISSWWHSEESADLSSLVTALCIRPPLQLCCPLGQFGPNCTLCPQHHCSHNGKCKGSGTRKGNGECLCNEGYRGERCDSCSEGYYISYRDSEKVLCTKCHQSCKGGCKSSGGPESCVSCQSGWIQDPVRGCLDIDECASLSPCNAKTQFCVNTPGSYLCMSCDPACLGCTGDGPDMCISCSEGHSRQEEATHGGGLLCTPTEPLESLDYARYLTYGGLTLATCIIFQKNTLVASLIGLSVALYVSLSEYWLHKIK